MISDVSKELDAKEGDVIGFYKDEKGNIIIKKVKIDFDESGREVHKNTPLSSPESS